LPAEYVLLALAASNATYCCAPAAPTTNAEKNTGSKRWAIGARERKPTKQNSNQINAMQFARQAYKAITAVQMRAQLT
jgi:hypothetical protein